MLKGAGNLYKKPILIEGPDGERIEEDAIYSWCREYRTPDVVAATKR